MSTQRKELSWEPVRRGAVFCAPACGSQCTWAAYQLAVAKSAELARRLGAGWQPRVHENMGWYWGVSNGPVSVSPGYGDTYHCLISDTDESSGGLGVWTPEKNYAKTPEAAIKLAMRGVRDYTKYITEAAARAEDAVRGLKV